jgi:hypothetical protein
MSRSKPDIFCQGTPWILHESEAFICKALKGEAIVAYAEPLIVMAL